MHVANLFSRSVPRAAADWIKALCKGHSYTRNANRIDGSLDSKLLVDLIVKHAYWMVCIK
jgi:hypothetical protein